MLSVGFVWLIFGLWIWHILATPDDVTSEHVPSATVAEKPQPDASGLSFHGYPCSADCSGHEAGYNWAEEHGISDAADWNG
jgi:hypothetical protein